MAAGLPTCRVAISWPGWYKSGDRLAYTSGRHMATSKYDYGCHMATGLLPTMVAIWRPRRFEPRSPFGDRVTVCPYRRMATQLNLANTVHSCLVFIDFSFELRSHCHSFRLDRSYCWNFTSNTAKTCFSRIGSSWSYKMATVNLTPLLSQ